jgi:hypothetical protein
MTDPNSIVYDKKNKTWSFSNNVIVHYNMKMFPLDMALVVVVKL